MISGYSGYCDKAPMTRCLKQPDNGWLSKGRALAVADFPYSDHVAKTVALTGYGRNEGGGDEYERIPVPAAQRSSPTR
jgi:hypothetical protein